MLSALPVCPDVPSPALRKPPLRHAAQFLPQSVDATSDAIRTVRIRLDRDYLVSVAGENLPNLRVYEVSGTDELHAVRRTDFESF